MAGSFGYKKVYYDISKNIGEDLLRQIEHVSAMYGQVVVLASGISCREQIGDGVPGGAMHPMEWLAERMAG